MNKLNELMAERVMGWGEGFIVDEDDKLWAAWKDGDTFVMLQQDWNPTHDPAQAMMCAEKLRLMNLEEEFVKSLILRLDLNVSLFYSALEGGGHTGGDVPKAIFAMITASPLVICEAIREAVEK